MSRKDIEARLDRSLSHQIAVPRLDRRFDAAVWARIAAAEAPAATAAIAESAALRATRWLSLTNWIGGTVTAAVAIYFLVQSIGAPVPVDVAMNVPVPAMVPTIPEALLSQVLGSLGLLLGAAALVFGLSLTSIGRRVRASFS